MTTRMREAALALLDALDFIEADEATAFEQAVEATVKRVARRYALDSHALWQHALDIERDPLEKYRGVIGPRWQPVLR